MQVTVSKVEIRRSLLIIDYMKCGSCRDIKYTEAEKAKYKQMNL